MNESMKCGLRYGAIGEQVTWNYLIQCKNVCEVWDVRADDFFQSVDVDFLVKKTDKKVTWIEVKTDSQAHRSGNIVYEVRSNIQYDTEGCFSKTKAKYVFYFLSGTQKLYMIDVEKLRQYVEINADDLEFKQMGDHAEGYLLKISELLKQKVMVEVNEQ